MGLQFVNIHGEAMSVVGQAPPKIRRSAPDSFHKGWRVVGFSPAQLEKARREHASGPDACKPFDEGAYMRKTKPTAVRSKPYEVWSAAEQCVEMAARSGWKGACAVPIAKGAR